ncbi:unnamed protein product [Polarella glacialis]|uniref:Uncharacterized protein n=1 Tax=Polarella glacialis TaxID=89957 RepID=A0A813LL43_POLGL|nr:unnamed protein product [Polarella glacialis]
MEMLLGVLGGGSDTTDPAGTGFATVSMQLADMASNDKESGISFLGVNGATSLKAEICGRVPDISDASHYREARKLLQDLGGASALKEELAFSGFVDGVSGQLTLNPKPFNVFAQFAAGIQTQPRSVEEQAKLGEFQHKFMICSNRHDNDIHWDSTDPKWINKASMAKRHRFLTTKNLHWQWFNPLVFGLVDAEDNGVPVRSALAEVEQMKTAALLYAKASGWTDKIGLFVNTYGHNSVNSLFVHVLDMNDLGPGFSFQAYKCLPLDAVLKVLREEVASGFTPTAVSAGDIPALRQKAQGRTFFFAGTDGATSIKEEIVGRMPVIKDASSYRAVRRMLMEELGGTEHLREELCRYGFLNTENERLTTGFKPFNVFARVASGEMKQPGMEEEQVHLGDFVEDFMVCSNRPENDDHWDSDDKEWVGKASMSKRHKFLTVKDLHWQWFNAVSFGIVPDKYNGAPLEKALAKVELMKAAALLYTANAGGWSDKVGLFFHVFGHNSVNSLHLHIVDLEVVGPTFWHFEYKNCPMDVVLKVMREEVESMLKVSDGRRAESKASAGGGTAFMSGDATQAAAQAANAAAQAAQAMITNQNAKANDSGRLHAGTENEILSLNVGGELVSVLRSTLLLAPSGSMLREVGSLGSRMLSQLDDDRRPFLDYPPVAFKIIVDHLRLIKLTPRTALLERADVPYERRQQVSELAWLLGVEDMVLGSPQPGYSNQEYPRLPKQPMGRGWFCCPQRRHISPAVASHGR